ncbi:oligosaccharide flippase family protein [Tamilnaduibacter salinus]|uniref:oligosaccharide flippase family protein n=1 Tax=Tamilnaduibacter salinus TaxID=1484056 RepID=UPI00130423E5
MLKYFADHFSSAVFKKLISNASVLLSGGLLVSLLGVVSVVLVARQLGPETFGIFALLTSTVLVVDRLVNFQSWQAVVRYGSKLHKDGDPMPRNFEAIVSAHSWLFFL